MRRTTKPQVNLILLMVLVSAVAQASASDKHKRLPPPELATGRRINVCVFPQPPLVPTFGDSQLFGSAVKKHANGDLEGAIADYLAAIKVQDKDPAVHWYLGTAYKAAGKEMDARREFEKEYEMKRTIDQDLRNKNDANSGVSILPAGDFGSNELLFVPGEGLNKWDER